MTNPIGVNGEFPQNGSMKLDHYEVQITKFLDSAEFNPRRAFEFTDKPTESGGTWYVNGGASSHRVRTPVSLVPATATGSYAQLDDFRTATSTMLFVGGGGAYSYVFNTHWVLSGLLGVAWGSQWTKFKLVSENQNNNVGSFKSQMKIAFGYSGEDFLSGLIVQSDSTQIDQQELELQLSAAEASVFFGWRF